MITQQLNDWEKLVSQQLKSDDIYNILKNDNLENVTVKPFYAESSQSDLQLNRAVEASHLISPYSENADEHVSAMILDHNDESLTGKDLFITSPELAQQIQVNEENRYYVLADIFNAKNGAADVQFGKELLAKTFSKNIAVDTVLFQNAGAAIYQQLGLALAKAKELTELFGVEVLDRIVFKFAIGSNYFFEIAKIRAFRLLMKQLAAEFRTTTDPFIYAETTLRNKTVNDAENNLIRSTLELSAGMIGGADALFANDFSIDKSTELSREIAFKQQIVLAYESILNVFEDGSAGSYYIEDLTLQFAALGWTYFVETEDIGGFTAAFESKKIHSDLYKRAVTEHEWVRDGKIKLIGVNLYPHKPVVLGIDQLYDKQAIKPVRWAEIFEGEIE